MYQKFKMDESISGGKSMYCHKCGAQNEDHAVFCNKCGTDLSQWSAQDMDKETRSWEIWKRPGDIIEFFGFMVLLISLLI